MSADSEGNGIRGSENGKYYLFSESRILVARLWPLPLAWGKELPGGAWRGMRPHLRIRERFLGRQRKEPVFRYREWAIPYEPRRAGAIRLHLRDGLDAAEEARRRRGYEAAVRAAGRAELAFSWIPPEVARVVGRFRFRQWHLLSMTARCPGALELIESNPGLALALANAGVFCRAGHRSDVKRRLLGCRRREIARWLGFPGREATVGILERVPPGQSGIVPLFLLRGLLHAPRTLVRLSHLPRIPALIPLLLSSRIFAPAIGDSFLHEIAGVTEASACDRLGGLMRDCVCMMRRGEQIRDVEMPRRIASVNQLRKWHDALVDLLNRRANAEMLSLVFRPPPIPGIPGIEPLTNVIDLMAEGRLQRNCVMSYAPQVAGGSLYIYRVTIPERATVSIEREGRRGWRIGEISGHGNRPVLGETRRFVEGWLRARVADAAWPSDQEGDDPPLEPAGALGWNGGEDDIPF